MYCDAFFEFINFNLSNTFLGKSPLIIWKIPVNTKFINYAYEKYLLGVFTGHDVWHVIDEHVIHSIWIIVSKKPIKVIKNVNLSRFTRIKRTLSSFLYIQDLDF